MIDEKEIAGLRHTEYNSDKTVMGMLDTLEKLWETFRAAEALARAMNDQITEVWPAELDDLNDALDVVLAEEP